LVLVETVVEDTSEFLTLPGRELVPVIVQEVEYRPRIVEAAEILVSLKLQDFLKKTAR